MNIPGLFPLRLTGLISLLSKGLSRVFSVPQFENISSSTLNLLYGPTLTSIHESLPSGSLHKPLILIYQRADRRSKNYNVMASRMKTTIIEHYPNWSHGSQPCVTQWNYEPCHAGSPKTQRSWYRVLTKRALLEKGMANHFSILASRTPWTVWKGKMMWHWKMNSPGL